MTRLLIQLALLAAATLTAAAADITPDALQKHLALETTLRCDYRQTRHISGMTRPLISTGTLEISQNSALLLNQQKPFRQTLRITPETIVTTIDKQPPEIITAKQNPRLFQFNQLLSALFRADHAALQKNFDFTLTGTSENWTLQLTPREDLLKKIFTRITLSGARHINTLRIEDRQNDTTTLDFTNHQNPITAKNDI